MQLLKSVKVASKLRKPIIISQSILRSTGWLYKDQGSMRRRDVNLSIIFVSSSSLALATSSYKLNICNWSPKPIASLRPSPDHRSLLKAYCSSSSSLRTTIPSPVTALSNDSARSHNPSLPLLDAEAKRHGFVGLLKNRNICIMNHASINKTSPQ